MIKQYIIVRKDLGISKGQMIAMGAHASMGIFFAMLQETGFDEFRLGTAEGWDWDDAVLPWIKGKFTKVVLGAPNAHELEQVYEAATRAGLPCSLIDDENIGMAAVAIGPVKSEDVAHITGHLKLL